MNNPFIAPGRCPPGQSVPSFASRDRLTTNGVGSSFYVVSEDWKNPPPSACQGALGTPRQATYTTIRPRSGVGLIGNGSTYDDTSCGPDFRSAPCRTTCPPGTPVDECDGGGTDPGAPGTSPGASAECSDGRDNDADMLADFGSDPGCLSAADNQEKDVILPAELPGQGLSNKNFVDANFGAGIGRYWAAFNPVLHESATPNHGPVPISGTPLCTGATTTVEAGVGSQAPTGGGLPPPPGAGTLRIVITTTDAPGGDPCTGTKNVRIAAEETG